MSALKRFGWRRDTALRWVGQEDAEGCVIACCAMLTGLTYPDVKAQLVTMRPDLAGHDWSSQETIHFDCDRLLHSFGFYLQRHYVAWYDASEWPLGAFAPVHLVNVQQPSGAAHAVVMDARGAVFDPLREGRFAMADWPKVNNIAGLVRR